MANVSKIVFSLLLAAGIGLLASCEKEVNINLTSGSAQLVVNGQIETGLPPFVVLTRSIGYFSKVDLATLQNSFIHDADVSVSDGSRSIRLREYTIDTFNTATGQGAKIYFYSVDTADPSSFSFVGATEHFYTLNIDWEGRKYTSITKIPMPQPIDSLVAEPLKNPDEKLRDAVRLAVYYSDPDTPGNAVRFFTKCNSEPYFPGLSSVVDDQVINGTKNGRYPIAAGSPRTRSDFSDSTGYVFKGDTVTLKWCAIDRGVFNFYQTFEYSIGTVGNPFSSPINVMTNITGGALGVWAGYGSTYQTIVVPK